MRGTYCHSECPSGRLEVSPMEAPQVYQSLAYGFRDQQPPFLWDQTQRDTLSSLHPRTGSQAPSEKDNIAKPQQGRRRQWVPSVVPRDEGRLKKVTIGRSSFRPLLDLTWNLILPPSSEPLLHLLLCEPFCLEQVGEVRWSLSLCQAQRHQFFLVEGYSLEAHLSPHLGSMFCLSHACVSLAPCSFCG